MKMICTILGTLMAASLIAQDNTNNLPAIPAPVSSPAAEAAPAPAPEPAPTTVPPAAPKHKKMHKAARKKPAVAEHIVPINPGPAEVTANDLVVRGQAGLQGEMVAHLHKGDTVNVLEEIELGKHAADEPSHWAKISYPTNAYVWVSARFVSNGVVATKKLNLRAGHGENYSVVGVLDEGTPVNVVETEGSWMKIEPPSTAYAFVAAKYLTATAAAPAPPAPPTMPEAAPTPTTVPEQQTIVTMPQPPPAPPVPTTPPVRIVEHEGIVGPVGSLTAPTDYKLYNESTKEIIDFLYPTSPNMRTTFSQLVDDRVIVTGEEGIESQWPNTPIMAVQSVEIISTNVIKRLDLTPPRQRH